MIYFTPQNGGSLPTRGFPIIPWLDDLTRPPWLPSTPGRRSVRMEGPWPIRLWWLFFDDDLHYLGMSMKKIPMGGFV